MYWYRRAAESGDAIAQFNLGIAYYEGEGVPKDYVHAYAWFNIAGMQNGEQARKARDVLEKKMTPVQIGKAQELSRKYLKDSVLDAEAE